MRRFVLLVLSAAMCSWLFTVFWSRVGEEELLTVTMVEQTETALHPVWQLPCQIPDTQLNALGLGVYDGPFWEDGSGDEVIGVCALVLKNQGEDFIREGEIWLESSVGRLEFAFSMLPPGESVMIPEKNRQKDRPVYLSNMGASIQVLPEDVLMSQIKVEELGQILLGITNQGQDTQSGLTLCYKTYDTPAQIYIGGSMKTYDLPELLPGETVEISPYGYVSGYSRVLSIIRE